MKANSIIIILPYFGYLPNTFPFWMESCKSNDSIDFLIVTDQNISSPAPNIIIVKSTLPKTKERIEGIVGIDVCLNTSYKLCDFRPIYGSIWKEYTDKYDFWGYCDCDLIFGDIRKFLTEDILNRYDYILGWGHFHIQRTIDPKFEGVLKSARGLWKDIGWKKVFQSGDNEFFDELPYGVSGRYYEMYPDSCWMGYADNHACFESLTSSQLTFRSLFNDYQLWQKWQGYQMHLKRLPFLKRKEGGDLKNMIFLKKGKKLFAIGENDYGKLEKREILYAHFYKRILSVKTASQETYQIRPNAFVDAQEIKYKLHLWLCSHHPSIFMAYIKYLICRKINTIKNKLL